MIKNVLKIIALMLCYIICYYALGVIFDFLEIEIKPKLLEFAIQYTLGFIIVNYIWFDKK